MVFGRKTGQKFYLGEKELQIVESYKYLGLMIDKNFNWKKHLENFLEKARKRTRALYGMGGGVGEGFVEDGKCWLDQ